MPLGNDDLGDRCLRDLDRELQMLELFGRR